MDERKCKMLAGNPATETPFRQNPAFSPLA